MGISTAHSFIVYVDEGGDDGIQNFREKGEDGGASPWLVIGCCIVRRENDGQIAQWRDNIISAFGRQKRDLHFKNLKHEQKLHACAELAKLPARYAVVMSNKTTIPDHPRPDLFHKKNTLYWYLCRYLVERVTVWCGRRAQQDPSVTGNKMAKFVFSRRGGLDYDDFRDYLALLKQKHNQEPSRINWQAIDLDAVMAVDHANSAGLQIADTPPSAFLRAVAPDKFGNVEPHYAKLLATHMIQNEEGLIIGTGVKPVPRLDQMTLTAAQKEIFEFYRRQKKWVGP